MISNNIINPGELLRPLKISEIKKDDYIPKSRNKILVEVLGVNMLDMSVFDSHVQFRRVLFGLGDQFRWFGVGLGDQFRIMWVTDFVCFCLGRVTDFVGEQVTNFVGFLEGFGLKPLDFGVSEAEVGLVFFKKETNTITGFSNTIKRVFGSQNITRRILGTN